MQAALMRSSQPGMQWHCWHTSWFAAAGIVIVTHRWYLLSTSWYLHTWAAGAAGRRGDGAAAVPAAAHGARQQRHDIAVRRRAVRHPSLQEAGHMWCAAFSQERPDYIQGVSQLPGSSVSAGASVRLCVLLPGCGSGVAELMRWASWRR